MAYARSATYPYPRDLKEVKDVEEYMKKLYASLLENDSRGEYLLDRATDIDLKQLIVRPEWYGAKGDGATDDTVAIQAAADALEEGGMLVFTPGATYKTNTIYINTSNVWVGCIGGQATLSIATSTCYGILVHGGAITAANRTLAYFNATFGGGDYNDSRISGVTVENLKITAFTTTKNTSIALMWADDCSVINCETEEGDGNGYDIRQCRRTRLYGCKSTSPAAYNVFCFQGANVLVENCDFSGATGSAISLKHRYNDEPCNHIVRGNRITSATGFYISGGYSLGSETAPYYTGNWEKVENVLIEGNVLQATASDTYCPNIAMCSYAFNWSIRNNVFIGGGVATGKYPLYIGTLGDWYTNGNLETYGENHVVDGNVFVDIVENRICDIGCSCRISGNIFDSTAYMVATDNSTYRLHDTIRMMVNDNRVSGALLSVSGSSGMVVASANVKILHVAGNNFSVTPTDSGANTWVSFIYSLAKDSYIVNNRVTINKGSANHATTYAIVVAGEYATIAKNYIGIDAQTTSLGVYVGSGATSMGTVIVGNTLEDLGSSTSYGIDADALCDIRFNQYVGGWTASESLTAGRSSVSSSSNYPLEFSAALGNKINLYSGGNWGIGLQGNLVQFINNSSAGDWAFGYGTTDSLTRVLTIDGAQGAGLGTTSFGTSATNTLSIANGTAPSTSPADVSQMYSADIAAGNAAPHFRTENGGVVKLFTAAAQDDLKADYTTGDLDSEAEIIAAMNATNTAFNTLLAKLRANGTIAT